MNPKAEKVAKILGAVMGLIIGLWLFVVAPMKSNYDECGRVTLCDFDDSR